MSKIEWSGLLEERLDDVETPAWDGAVEELRHSRRERRRAVEADPLLVFQNLPRVEPSAAEVDDMKAAVRAGRSVRQLAPEAGNRWLRRGLGVAGLIAAVTLFLGPLVGGLLRPGLGGGQPETVWSVAPASAPQRATPPSAAAPAPAIEDLQRPGARVYQMREGDLSVVLIVDETLDVGSSHDT